MKIDRRKTSMEWPTAVDERLRMLVSLVDVSWPDGPTSAAELVAALICEQPLDGPALAGRVARYRELDLMDLAAANRMHADLPRGKRRGRPRRSAAGHG